MKRLTLFLSLLFMISATALSAPRVGFGLHGNYASLIMREPVKDIYGPGYGGGLHLDLRFGMVTLRANGDYTTFGADHDVYRDLVYRNSVVQNPNIVRNDISVEGARINVLSFSVNGKVGLPNQPVSPYAIVGVGTATLSMSDINISYQGTQVVSESGAETETKFKLDAGAGVDFNLGGPVLFVEGRYAWVFTTDEKTKVIFVTAGVTF